MCGISGVFYNQKDKVNAEKFINFSKINLLRRGPDFSGQYANNKNIIFNHNKLSIMDNTINGNQPLKSSCGKFVMIFNGEIYNFLNLRNQILKLKNYTFLSSGDAEVLIESFSTFGIKNTLEKIDGMYAIALFDIINNKLYIIGDFFGEKPIYYSKIDRNFYFSSNLNCLDKNFSLNINYNSLKKFFLYKYIPGHQSIYENVYKVKPNEMLTIQIKNDDILINKETYKTVIKDYNFKLESSTSAHNLLNSIITESVLQRSRPNCGVFLSGGIDSSLIASILQNNSEKKIQTFSIGFEDKKFDEIEKVSLISKHLGCLNEKIVCKESDLEEFFFQLPEVYDEPFSDSSQLPTLLLSKLSSNYTRVCLAGDGADELFGGYSRYNSTLKKWNFRNFKHLVGSLAYKFIKNSSCIENIVFYNKHKNFEDFYISNNWLNIFHEKIIKNFKLSDQSFFTNKPQIEDMMNYDKSNYLPYDILVKVDRASMYHSLEVRLPFLSQKIYSFSKSLLKSKFKNFYDNKNILRNILSNYLPVNITNQQKKGFSIDLQNFILKKNFLFAENAFKYKNFLNNYFDFTQIKNMWERFKSGDNRPVSIIYSYITLYNWLKFKNKI